MASLYATIKTIFDADATLCPAVFTELFLGEAPADTAKTRPYCVIVPSEDNRVVRTFGRRYIEESFSLNVVADTFEDADADAEIVETAFDEIESALSAAGVDVLTIDQEPRRFRQDDESLWVATVNYSVVYAEDR